MNLKQRNPKFEVQDKWQSPTKEKKNPRNPRSKAQSPTKRNSKVQAKVEATYKRKKRKKERKKERKGKEEVKGKEGKNPSDLQKQVQEAEVPNLKKIRLLY